MADSMLSITYTYYRTAEIRSPNGFGDMERTGVDSRDVVGRTIIVPATYRDQFLEMDKARTARTNRDYEFIALVREAPVDLMYPAPHYWSN